MRIYPARISSRGKAGKHSPGVTLIELLVVLGLMALVLVLAVPTFQNLFQGTLQREVNHLTGVIRLLRNEAVLGNTRFQLMIDLKGGGFHIEQADRFGNFSKRSEPKVLRPHQFPDSLVLRDMVLFGKVIRLDERKPVAIRIDASGYIDPFLLHFNDGSEDYTLRVSGFTGIVELIDGYAES